MRCAPSAIAPCFSKASDSHVSVRAQAYHFLRFYVCAMQLLVVTASIIVSIAASVALFGAICAAYVVERVELSVQRVVRRVHAFIFTYTHT